MDNLVKCYLPAEFDATVEGNAVAREAGTTLTGAQVTGTLVLADGVADTTVSLTDTKVSDRLVVPRRRHRSADGHNHGRQPRRGTQRGQCASDQ